MPGQGGLSLLPAFPRRQWINGGCLGDSHPCHLCPGIPVQDASLRVDPSHRLSTRGCRISWATSAAAKRGQSDSLCPLSPWNRPWSYFDMHCHLPCTAPCYPGLRGEGMLHSAKILGHILLVLGCAGIRAGAGGRYICHFWNRWCPGRSLPDYDFVWLFTNLKY